MISAFLQFAIESRQRAKAIDQVGELRGDLVLRGFRLKESDALEGTVAAKLGVELALRTGLQPLCQPLARHMRVRVDDAGHGLEQRGELLVPDLEARDLVGET